MLLNIKREIKDLWNLFFKFLKRFYKISFRPEMRILPGNLAFFLVLSFAPIITIIALLATRFSLPLISIIRDFKNMIPDDLFQMLEIFLTETRVPNGSILIYLFIGFASASNGAHSIIIASNTLYKVKGESLIKRRIKSFFLTIILVLQFIFILVFLVFGNIIMKWILSFALFDGVRNFIYSSFIFLKWPLMMFITFILVKLLYAIAPDTKVSSKNVTRGALFTTFGWTLVTAAYSYYANNWADYSVFYGGLSNLIILMMWIYVVSYVLVMGISMNVSYYETDKG